MSIDKLNSDKEPFSFSMLSALIIGYFTICSILWHLGYWSTFQFNFLEYANIADLFKSTIYPFFSRIWVLVAVILMSAGSSFSWYVLLRRKRYLQGRVNEPSVFDFSKYDSPHMIFDSLMFGSLAIGGMLLATSGAAHVSIIAPALGFFFGMFLTKQGLFKKYFNDDFVRLLVIVMFCLYASVNFSIAKREALDAQIGFRYNKIIDAKLKDTTMRNQILNKALLGTTENYSFILLGSSAIVTLKNGEIQSITTVDFIDPRKWAER